MLESSIKPIDLISDSNLASSAFRVIALLSYASITIASSITFTTPSMLA